MAKSRSSIGTVETVETNKSPERILWKAVLATAVKDALKTQGVGGWISPADKTLARQWFLFPNIGCYRVCEMAGYEPHFVKKKMITKINQQIEKEKASNV